MSSKFSAPSYVANLARDVLQPDCVSHGSRDLAKWHQRPVVHCFLRRVLMWCALRVRSRWLLRASEIPACAATVTSSGPGGQLEGNLYNAQRKRPVGASACSFGWSSGNLGLTPQSIISLPLRASSSRWFDSVGTPAVSDIMKAERLVTSRMLSPEM